MIALLILPAVTVAHDGTPLGIHGAGVSHLASDTRVLAIEAVSTGATTDADGLVQFIHLGPAGLSRFGGIVDCLQLNEDGIVQISGRVTRGETAAGNVLDGLDYAFSVHATGAQSFSLPRFGAAGSIEPCSGGRAETVLVSEGRFVATAPDS